RVDLAAPLDALRETFRVRVRVDELAGELVERLVLQQRLVEPGGDLLAAAVDVAGALVLVAKQIVPEGEPVVGVSALVVEQAAQQVGALIAARIGEEGVKFRRGGQQANEVEVDAAGEGGIVERRRGGDFVPDEVVAYKQVNRTQGAAGARRRDARAARL